MPAYNIAELMLFSTCNYRCGYCSFALDGSNKNKDDIHQYRDTAYIDQIVSFFDTISDEGRKWIVHMSGGEPLLMPNYNYFVRSFVERGHRIALNTNLSIPIERNGWLNHNRPEDYDGLYISMHQQSLDAFDTIYERVRILKEEGFPLYIRMVGHPVFMHRLPELEEAFRDIDVSFSVNALYSPNYPKAYTDEQRSTLMRYMRIHYEAIRLLGGLDMRKRVCYAGSRMICLDLTVLGRGKVYPCVSTIGEANCMGDIYTGITLEDRPVACKQKEKICSCAIHFMHDIIPGMYEHDRQKCQLTSYAPDIRETWEAWFTEHGVVTRYHEGVPQGTVVGENVVLLSRVSDQIRDYQMLGNLPAIRSWKAESRAVVADIVDGVTISTPKGAFSGALESPVFRLTAGAYCLCYSVEIESGGCTVGIQDGDGVEWIKSANYRSSGTKTLLWTIPADRLVKILVANFNDGGESSRVKLSGVTLLGEPGTRINVSHISKMLSRGKGVIAPYVNSISYREIDSVDRSWTSFGNTSVSTEGREIFIDGGEDSFGYLAQSDAFILWPGVYSMRFSVTAGTGSISIGVQGRGGRKWLCVLNGIKGGAGECSFTIFFPQSARMVIANCNDGPDKRSQLFVHELKVASLENSVGNMAHAGLEAVCRRWRVRGLPMVNGLRLEGLRVRDKLLLRGDRLHVRQVVEGGYAVRSLAVHMEGNARYLLSADVGDDRISFYPLDGEHLGRRGIISFTERSAPMSLKSVSMGGGRDITLAGLFNFDESGLTTPDSVVLQLPPIGGAGDSATPQVPGVDCPVLLSRKGHWGYRGMALDQKPSGDYYLAVVDRDQSQITVLTGRPEGDSLSHDQCVLELPKDTEPIGVAPFPVQGSDRPAFVMTARKSECIVVLHPDDSVTTIPLGDRSRSSVAVGCFRSKDRPEVAVALWGGDPTLLNEYGEGSLAVIDPMAQPGEQVLRVPAGVHPTDVACGDLDGDGLDEIVLLNYGVGLGPADRSHMGSVMVFKFKDNEFKCVQELSLPNPRIALVEDLDGDGRAEVVVSLFFEKKLVVLKTA